MSHNYHAPLLSYHVILHKDNLRHTGALILGGIHAATDSDLLEEHNVKIIITTASGLDQIKVAAEQTHIVFPLSESKNECIERYF